VAVYEKEKSESFHLHACLFHIQYVDATKMAELWGQGFIKINRIEKVNNVGAYVSKYFTKEMCENKRQKLYLRSFNLLPFDTFIAKEYDVYKFKQTISKQGKSLDLQYEKTYKDFFGNDCVYQQFKVTTNRAIFV